MTTADYLNQLIQDRDDLVDNLTTMGITGLTGDETFTELVPRVLDIGGGGGEDYTFIEYIENTDDGYINTDYVHNANTKIVAEFYAHSNNNNYPFLFGAKNNNNTMAFLVNHQYLGGAFMYQRSNKEAYSRTSYYNQKVTLTIDGASASYTNGTNTINLTISGASMDQGVAPLVLFNSNSGTAFDEVVITEQYMLGKIYSFKIYTNDTLERDFVPAIRNSDNAIGMYDNVSQAFFENEGNTEFTAGPVVS